MAGPRWQIAWARSGIWSLREIPWRDAERVDAAVQRFAATGEGELDMLTGHGRGGVLKVGSYRARLTFDRAAQTLTVWWIYRV